MAAGVLSISIAQGSFKKRPETMLSFFCATKRMRQAIRAAALSGKKAEYCFIQPSIKKKLMSDALAYLVIKKIMNFTVTCLLIVPLISPAEHLASR